MSNPQRTVIDINGSGGAFVLLSASLGSWGYVEVAECPPGGSGNYAGGDYAAQGLEYQLASENYANTYPAVPGEIISIGDAFRKNRSIGMGGFTLPGGEVRPGTPYMKVRSATATATQVLVKEWSAQ